MYSRFKEYYFKNVCSNILNKKNLIYKNIYQVPKIEKILINRGIGDASQNPRILETSQANLSFIK